MLSDEKVPCYFAFKRTPIPLSFISMQKPGIWIFMCICFVNLRQFRKKTLGVKIWKLKDRQLWCSCDETDAPNRLSGFLYSMVGASFSTNRRQEFIPRDYDVSLFVSHVIQILCHDWCLSVYWRQSEHHSCWFLPVSWKLKWRAGMWYLWLFAQDSCVGTSCLCLVLHQFMKNVSFTTTDS